MGIFRDIFIASEWSYNELKAINKCLIVMGVADGELDEQEVVATFNMLSELPGAEHVTDWESFVSESTNMDNKESLDLLSKMSRKKREKVVGMLAVLAMADGVIDENENRFFVGMCMILNVEIPS